MSGGFQLSMMRRGTPPVLPPMSMVSPCLLRSRPCPSARTARFRAMRILLQQLSLSAREKQRLPGVPRGLRIATALERRPVPGKPLAFLEKCDGFSLRVVESAVVLLRGFVTRRQLCGYIIRLSVHCSLEPVHIEAAGEDQHLPDLFCAADAMEMSVPPLALLLLNEIGDAPGTFRFAPASFVLRRLTSTAETLGALASLALRQ